MTKPGKVELAKALNVAGAVEYQEGAVVSREVLRKQTGTVTVFAFDAGQGLSEHTSPYDATVLVVEGEAVLMIGGQRVVARAGELTIMPANVPHDVRAERRFKMLLIMIREKVAATA